MASVETIASGFVNSGILRLEFYGGMATRHELDLYDAGRSIEGLGRTVSILAHYLQTGKVISQAPASKAYVSLRPPQSGSFVIEVLVGVTSATLAVPITLYITHVFNQWLPGGSAADKARIARLQSEIAIQRERLDGLERAIDQRDRVDEVSQEVEQLKSFVKENQKEHDVIRSITSNSFLDIYRPIGRSATHAVAYGDRPGAYAGVVDEPTVALLDTEIADADITTVAATVDAFSRKSKRGTAFSAELGRGFRFHYGQMGKLGSQDDFSWSQYQQKPVLMTGRFHRFYDKSIKRLEVTAVQRMESSDLDDLLG
jgi:hypothetical protein